jgi:hypothetical protein
VCNSPGYQQCARDSNEGEFEWDLPVCNAAGYQQTRTGFNVVTQQLAMAKAWSMRVMLYN